MASELRDLSIALRKANPISEERAIELKKLRRKEKAMRERKLS